MVEKLKVGVLGYGKMGKVYADWFSNNPNCELAAIYNHSDKRRAEVKADHPSAAFYDDWKTLMAEQSLDIVGICTPTADMMGQIKEAVGHGINIICEKPVTMDLDQLKELDKLLEGYDKKFHAASELRYHPVFEKVSGLLGGLGKIFLLDINYSMYRDEVKWKHLYASGGGVLRELGQHVLDVVSDWMGEAESVYGQNLVVDPRREVEDVSVNVVKYKNGALLNLVSHYFSRSDHSVRGTVYGTEGQVNFAMSSYDVKDSRVTLYKNDCKPVVLNVDAPEKIDRIYPGQMDDFGKAIDMFVEDVMKGNNGNNLGQEYTNTQIIDASYESTGRRQAVELPLEGFSMDRLKEIYG
jgi:predicted dehydrogenase